MSRGDIFVDTNGVDPNPKFHMVNYPNSLPTHLPLLRFSNHEDSQHVGHRLLDERVAALCECKPKPKPKISILFVALCDGAEGKTVVVGLSQKKMDA